MKPSTRLFLLLVVLPALAVTSYVFTGLKGVAVLGLGFGFGVLMRRTLG